MSEFLLYSTFASVNKRFSERYKLVMSFLLVLNCSPVLGRGVRGEVRA
jgi:hypothetical protein